MTEVVPTTSRRLREDRDARMTADAGYDVSREVWDLAQTYGLS